MAVQPNAYDGGQNDTYENPIQQGQRRYENLETREEPKSQRSKHHVRLQQTCQWRVLLPIMAIVVFGLLSIVFLILIYHALSNMSLTKTTPAIQAPSASVSTTTSPAGATAYRSCWEWKQAGSKTSGIYTITPTQLFAPFRVYCDMTSGGGGWTLVASIHRDQVSKKCTTLDKWSAPAPNDSSLYTAAGSSNWCGGSNFGSISSCTAADFKSQAYYSVPATDVMISHVPDNTPLQDIATSSLVTYYTNDQFLAKRGGTLERLYRDYFPLYSFTIIGMNAKVLQMVVQASGLYTLTTVPQLDGVTYQQTPTAGITFVPTSVKSSTAFSENGFSVYFSLNNLPYTLMKTGQAYTDGLNYHIQAEATQPYLVLATVANQQGFTRFRLKVHFTLKTYAGYQYQAAVDYSYRGYNIHYVHGYRHSYSPFVDEVFFAITAPKKWNAANFSFKISKLVTNLNVTTVIELGNTTRNTLLGYMFLPRAAATVLDSATIQKIINVVVDDVDPLNILDFNKAASNLVVGVTYAKRSVNYTSTNVQTGFLQIGAHDTYGYSYAMCPGVKLGSSSDPALYCVGSANSNLSHPNRCGDFAAWDQLPDHVSWNRNTYKKGKFVNDLHSTLLVFTRSKNTTLTL